MMLLKQIFIKKVFYLFFSCLNQCSQEHCILHYCCSVFTVDAVFIVFKGSPICKSYFIEKSFCSFQFLYNNKEPCHNIEKCIWNECLYCSLYSLTVFLSTKLFEILCYCYKRQNPWKARYFKNPLYLVCFSLIYLVAI